eukprot:CAMPEP_0117545918 /NCGR_PEP_ID=MMETSP0784-20121206/46342_1 /TAXON_ID=39447 /ORGANISM="" /LENGTH=274 /DNA_ID=CAMNT_0005342779 /DNA_START=30 /DNA_END=854 /DNA_ORIENTATION=+
MTGEELEVTLPVTCTVRDLKQHIDRAWDFPVLEQRLLLDGRFLTDQENLWSVQDAGFVQLLRGPPYQFDRSLMHRNANVSDDGCEIVHGGQDEYQAGFLSGILDRHQVYRVQFELEDNGGHNFAEMYFGIAPHIGESRKPPNWSNLKGAYMNRRGMYVDAFQPFGWVAEDFSTSYRRREIFGNANKVIFVMEVDMPKTTLRFFTRSGHAMEILWLPDLATTPVCLCATVGYTGQRVAVSCPEDADVVYERPAVKSRILYNHFDPDADPLGDIFG